MLDKLSLHSFQAHEDTVLDFSSGVNIITGVSNSGKTSIVRALNWLVNNRPLGDGFINDGSDETFCDLRFKRRDCSYTVRRSRNRKTNNSYQMGPVQQTFTAFGNSVPEEISSLLNLSDINFQHQLSPYFLVLDSPGQIALYIRKVARLDEVDEVISLLASKIRDCSEKKSGLDEDLSDTRKKLEEISIIDTDKLEKLISEVKLIEQEKERASNQRLEIESIVNQLRQLDIDMICLPDNIDEKIDLISSSLSNYEDLLDTVGYLEDIVVSLKEVIEKKINLPKDVESKISCIEILITEYNKNELEFIWLSESIENLEGYEMKLSELNEETVQVEGQRKDLLSQLTNCPYCERGVTEISRKVLVGE